MNCSFFYIREQCFNNCRRFIFLNDYSRNFTGSIVFPDFSHTTGYEQKYYGTGIRRCQKNGNPAFRTFGRKCGELK